MIDTAIDYLAAGLCVLPAVRAEKRPALSGWKAFQSRLPSRKQIEHWFNSDRDAMCIVAGSVSGNLEVIDFDHQAARYEAWVSLIPPELLGRLVIERTQSGGRHVVYRCVDAVCGNIKLSQALRDGKLETLIETRGEGGLFLCDPTTGYTLEQGTLTDLPILSSAERESLLEAAWSLNEHLPPPVNYSCDAIAIDGRPGDEFNERGDVREVLVRNGWTLAKPGVNEYWRRPGKDVGWSATLRDRVFYVFSGNAAPFEPNRAYSPFSVLTLLEHGGDFGAAASVLRTQGFGYESRSSDPEEPIGYGAPDLESQRAAPIDPGPLPEEMLRIPGFISEVMDHCLATAPYPNFVMAFSGAIALQAYLAGRKVRDPGDNRTNLYLLGLAHSAAGKDWPRKVNTRILHEIGVADCLGERFASGEGIQDALFISPSMLFQTDEIDGLLQSINKARDARHENIMTTLLTLYSSANSVFPMRRKAGRELPGQIDQPSLVIFGTAIPNHYYEALSERMLTNGFFARMIILECGRRGAGQEPRIQEIPSRVVDTARWWYDFRPGTGNLQTWHPVPAVVQYHADARSLLVEARLEAEREYERAESASDAVGTTVWGRVSEQTRKLALLYAISQNATKPEIGRDAAEWAVRFVMHQTRRMLFMASSHVAENPFQADCLKLLRKLRDAPEKQLAHSVLLKRMKMGSKEFGDLVATLEQRGEVEKIVVTRPGTSHRAYRLRGEMCDGG